MTRIGILAAILLALAGPLHGQDTQSPETTDTQDGEDGEDGKQDLAATAVELPRVADRYRPGDTLAWNFALAGTPIGDHAFRYEGPVELPGGRAHRFREWTRLSPAAGLPVENRIAGELWTDDRGHALAHVLQVAQGEAHARVDATFGDGNAHVELLTGAVPRDLDVPLPGPVYHQANNVLGGFDVILALNPVGRDASLTVDLFSSNVLQVFPYEVAWQRAAQDEEDTEAAAVLADSLGETLTVSADGHLLRLEVPGQRFVARRADELPPLFELAPPDDVDATGETTFDSEDVTIVHGDVTLAGTITRPRGATGRLPAVFFVSGSGTQDRQGFSAGLDVGTHEILDRLTADGLLVLRVDDRGAGLSTGPTENIGLSDLVADARAAVDFLAARDDVDPRRIALIGHSEGGVTASILAAEAAEDANGGGATEGTDDAVPAAAPIAAVVLMASTARPLPEIMLDQNARVLARSGLPAEEQAAALAEIRARFERLAGDEELDAADLGAEFSPLLANRKWFREHARSDPAATLAAVPCPVLVLQGARDFQVSPDKDARALDAALSAAEHPDHELVVFPDLDHLFKRTPSDESVLADYFTRREVDEEFLATLSVWLTSRLAPEG